MESPFAHILSALRPGLLEQPPVAAADPAAIARQAEADAVEARRLLLVSQGVPIKHARLIASGALEDTFAVKTVRRWLDGRKLLLVLYGAPDSSKSTASALAVDIAMTRWLASTTRRISAPRMIAAENLHKAWLYRDVSLDRVQPLEPITRTNQDQLLTSGLVVVDDFAQEGAGIAHLTIDAVETLAHLRSSQGLRMLITSNLPSTEAIFAYMGDRKRRFAERITEFGVCVECPVEGYRGGRGRPTT